jgi:gamma-glutamyltranspeptidase/glutathione hydrolase
MRGAVAAGHPLTAEAGARTLADGGNAVDACVTAALVAWVAESPLTGPGAGGFMLVHRPGDRRDTLLDFFVAVPGLGLSRPPAELEAVDVPFGSGDTTQRFLIGSASCAVPGAVAGLYRAHRLFGTIPWPRLVEPAAMLAREGVELSQSQALFHAVLDAVLRRNPDGRAIYGQDVPLRVGERVVMSDLAATLELLARDGADAFYRGELASSIAALVRERGGCITAEDLDRYRVVLRRPVRAAYRGHELVSNPPPSSGGILIAYTLRLLDRLGPGGPPGSAGALARLAEVGGAAARARGSGFIQDLRRGGVTRRLLADERVNAAVSELLARRVPADAEPAGLPSTTHVSVVDADGMAASLSSSTGCGSGVFVPGTGIHLNNMLGEIDLNPPGAPTRPGGRLTSMMAPTILLRDGQPRVVLGSAGSERLRGAIVQTIVNVVDHGLPISEAIELPRVHLDGADLHCEGGIDPQEADRLERLGYRLVRWPGRERNLYFGGVSAVGVRGDGGLEAAGDPRRGGAGTVVGEPARRGTSGVVE